MTLGSDNWCAEECYNDGFIGIDYGIKGDLSNDLGNWQDFSTKYRKRYLELNPGKNVRAAGQASGVLWRVCKGINEEDVVICPDGKGKYYVGKVTSGYYYQSNANMPHRRKVKWFHVFERSSMSQNLKNSSNSALTAVNISRHAEELERLIYGNSESAINTNSLVENPSKLNKVNKGQTVKVASCTVEELFSENIHKSIFGTLEIPEYQRPYVWGEKEVSKLLFDIKQHNEKQDEKPMYYMGSIILHQHDSKLSIIDGQQRLTTLAIIQHIKGKLPKIKYASPTTIDHIKKNHEYLRQQKIIDLNFIDFANLNVTLVVTDNEDDAYTFFETSNTGGVRLSGIDIIKAHHLREISTNGSRDEQYATVWEKQKNLDVVVEQLIKARRWNVLNWNDVPSDRDLKGTKESIIADFSEKTVDKKEKAAYNQIIATENYASLKMSPYKLAIRQPLANGENFIDYIEQYAELYQRLFNSKSDAEILNQKEYYKFDKDVIKDIDGTAFLKELYEIAILCYANRFGVENLLEASYWIFRYTYSLRVSNQKTVRENSIPAFIKNSHFVFDVILSSFTHQELIASLKEFKYNFNPENLDGNTVKFRFVERVSKYFGGNIDKDDNYDNSLTIAIDKKMREVLNGQ